MIAAIHQDAPRTIDPADHLKLVGKIAGRHAATHQPADFDDIVQEGYVGMLAAARRFDPARKLRFSTFAWPYVAGAISDHLGRGDGPIRVCPNAAWHEARARRNGTPIEELPTSVRGRVEAVRKLRGMSRVGILNTKFGIADGGEPEGAEFRGSVSLLANDQGPASVDNADEVSVLIGKAKLSPNQTTCLLAFIGLDGQPPRTAIEIAKERGVSRYYPTRTIQEALAKLRRAAGVAS